MQLGEPWGTLCATSSVEEHTAQWPEGPAAPSPLQPLLALAVTTAGASCRSLPRHVTVNPPSVINCCYQVVPL